MGTQPPFLKKGAEPLHKFSAHVLGRLVQATLYLMGTQLPCPKKGATPQFSAHFYCGQTAGCIKMPLGMEVGFSPGDFMLDGDPAPYPKRAGAQPNFRPMSIVAKRLHGLRCHLVRR